jgi:hypothetical protein
MDTMTRIHFIGGEKGGVGKSVVARVLSQYFIDRKTAFLGFDSDRSHGSLLRFYSDFAAPVTVDSFEGLDSIVEAGLEHPERRIVVDLAAQTHRFLSEWMAASDLLGDENGLDLALTYWHVMDAGRDSAELLARLLDDVGGRLPLIVVLNEIRGGDFSILKGMGLLERAAEAGAHVISIARLQDAAMQKIDASNTSFWAATQRNGGGTSSLGILERQRVKHWLHKAYAELDTLGDRL